MKPERASWRREALICSLLTFVTVAVYWPVRHFEFLDFDDPAYITANPNVFRGFSAENVAWAFGTFHAANWHPMTWLSHILDCQFFGYKPGLHHLTSLFFHTFNALLLFGLWRRLTGAVWRSAIVAALFAWHPLHVESVAWVAERKDVLSTFFALLALGAYARYAEKAKAGGKYSVFSIQYSVFKERWYVASLLCFILGLMSKPMVVTLPFVMLLLDYWPLKRSEECGMRNAECGKGKVNELNGLNQLNRLHRGWGRLWVEKAPFFALSIVSSIVTLTAQKTGEAVVDTVALPFSARLINAVMGYAGYLRKMVWPADLASFYPYRAVTPAGEVLVALLILIAVSVLVFRWSRRAPYLAVGWLWYLGMLVPVIGLVQVGAQSMADRYTYLPLVGVFVMLAWGAVDLLAGFRHRAAVAGAVSTVVLAACLGTTWFQEKYWHDDERLFGRDLELFPQNNATAHHALGRALYQRGDDAGAIAHYEAVLRLLPNYARARFNLANCLSRQGRIEEAQAQYREAIRLRPDNAEAYKSLGTLLAAQMKLDEARTNFLTALRYKPDYPEAHTRLGTLLMAEGKVDEAVSHLAAAVRIFPEDREGQYYLAHALEDQKKFEEAAIHYRAAIKASPDYDAALNDLAWMWVTEGDPQRVRLTEAISLARRACELTHGSNAAYLETLGAALSDAGQLPEAIETTEKAVAAAVAAGNPEMAAEMRKRLAMYRAGRSYSSSTRVRPGSSP